MDIRLAFLAYLSVHHQRLNFVKVVSGLLDVLQGERLVELLLVTVFVVVLLFIGVEDRCQDSAQPDSSTKQVACDSPE